MKKVKDFIISTLVCFYIFLVIVPIVVVKVLIKMIRKEL